MLGTQLKKEYLLPVRVLAQEGCERAEYLCAYHTDQSYFGGDEGCTIAPKGWVLLDFGREYSGGVRLIVNNCAGEKNAVLRIRFGESATEACSEIGEKGSTNDHSVRDALLTVAWVSSLEYGNTGYRFIRIDNPWKGPVSLRQVFGVYMHCGAERRGKFSCSDERLNAVWETGARSVYLNMQDYLYDGIKRDRVVWIGDMHPAASSVQRLFGAHPVVPKSLDHVRDHTPPDRWMNDIPTYTCWWLKLQWDWYRFTGDKTYLEKQLGYLRALLPMLSAAVGADGTDRLEFKFIDWPSSDDPVAQTEGVRALLLLAFESAANILQTAGGAEDAERIGLCRSKAAAIRAAHSVRSRNKQAAALSVFSGLADARFVNETLLSREPTRGVSTFLGYYVLRARGDAGDVKGALDLIRTYWGAMLDLGATTFWEDFDLAWAKGARPVDALLGKGEYDVHGDNGNYCYRGFRHSLCHGWASGPVPFLSEYVLGVRIAEEGCRKLIVSPDLGDLAWAEGVVPTPLGDVFVRHERVGEGIHTNVQAPSGVEIVQCNDKGQNYCV